MKKYIAIPLIIYILTSIFTIFLPTTDIGYNQVLWKLLLGQVYAIPLLVIASFISYFLLKHNQKEKVERV